MSFTFPRDPLWYIRGNERRQAIESLRRYLTDFTGAHFERLADHGELDRFTANDLVAVAMLGVDLPALAALHLLEDDAHSISGLLAQLPQSHDALWATDALAPDKPAWTLYYRLLDEDGLGRTRASKLLAAKRPHLIPIYDSVVGDALGIGDNNDDWAAWRAVLAEPSTRGEVAEVRDAVAAAAHLSLLRTLDIVIWMRHKGWAQIGRDLNPIDPTTIPTWNPA